jgi:hypothetical protein
MKGFKLLTLVDITETKQYRREPGKELLRDQEQNFQMLLQTIGLRVNPIYTYSPTIKYLKINSKPQEDRLITQNIDTLSFGSVFIGLHKVWIFNFATEYDDGFTDEVGNECGFLINDLHLVPFIPNLSNTVKFHLPVFDTKSIEDKNTLIFSINTI